MRRPVVLILAALLTLSACDADPVDPTPSPGAPEPTAEDIAAVAGIDISGPLGAAPTVGVSQPIEVSVPVGRVDVEGTGEVLTEGFYATYHYAMYDGDDGTLLGDTWTLGSPDRMMVGSFNNINALNDVLKDQRVGVRVILATPAEGPADSSARRSGTLMVIEVTDIRPGRAIGTEVELPEGLPEVERLSFGEPRVTVPEGLEKPSELLVQPLIQGAGPVVESGDFILMHYKSYVWGGTVVDSTWIGQPTPTPIGTGDLIKGLDQGLIGQNAGSQVMIIIPPELAYGSEGYQRIPADATMIVVVDIIEIIGGDEEAAE